jgi:hypothetical protein
MGMGGYELLVEEDTFSSIRDSWMLLWARMLNGNARQHVCSILETPSFNVPTFQAALTRGAAPFARSYLICIPGT